MEKIKSFLKDHENMQPGFSFSGEQKGVSTFDLRFKKPNEGDYLSCAVLHSIEHLLATALRNGAHGEDVIYFGPMGCRTGFYLLTVERTEREVRDMLAEAIRAALSLEEVPGAAKAECGNYLEHDLAGAREALTRYLALLGADHQIP